MGKKNLPTCIWVIDGDGGKQMFDDGITWCFFCCCADFIRGTCGEQKKKNNEIFDAWHSGTMWHLGAVVTKKHCQRGLLPLRRCAGWKPTLVLTGAECCVGTPPWLYFNFNPKIRHNEFSLHYVIMDSTSLSLYHASFCTQEGQRQAFDPLFQRYIVGDELGQFRGALHCKLRFCFY